MDNKHYVYKHLKSDTGVVFYVSSGKDAKAWTVEGNKPWFKVVNEHGYNVVLTKEGLSKEEALIVEQELITEIGLENLTNE